MGPIAGLCSTRSRVVFAPGRMTASSSDARAAARATLLELMACLRSADAGEVADGRRADRSTGTREAAALRRAGIGYLAQEPVPVGFLSAEENVASG